ncbi:hypothetical protein CDAR_372291 [Caerostris darwini]|uniref:BRISC complex subunit Abro1 n=1 Tax=Caerostris darwini TaxID=1538125 RepID=A0AAV4WW39_9ARAC|nr:hypothetical protein CDAR_372291 [Caerostris darwini]
MTSLPKLHLSPFVLSTVMFDSSNSVGDQEGFLIGRAQRCIRREISDHSMYNTEEDLIISIYSCVPCGSFLSFYDSCGNVDESAVRECLGERIDSVVGWYRYRRNVVAFPSAREMIVHRNLKQLFPENVFFNDENIIFAVFGSACYPSIATHTYDYAFYVQKAESFRALHITLLNLGDTKTEYRGGSLSGSFINSNNFNSILEYPWDFSCCWQTEDAVQNMHRMLREKCDSLAEELAASESVNSIIEQEVQKLDSELQNLTIEALEPEPEPKPESGPSCESEPSISHEPQPGHSTKPQPGSSSEPQPGPSHEPQPGPSHEPQPGPSHEPQPGTSRESESARSTKKALNQENCENIPPDHAYISLTGKKGKLFGKRNLKDLVDLNDELHPLYGKYFPQNRIQEPGCSYFSGEASGINYNFLPPKKKIKVILQERRRILDHDYEALSDDEPPQQFMPETDEESPETCETSFVSSDTVGYAQEGEIQLSQKDFESSNIVGSLMSCKSGSTDKQKNNEEPKIKVVFFETQKNICDYNYEGDPPDANICPEAIVEEVVESVLREEPELDSESVLNPIFKANNIYEDKDDEPKNNNTEKGQAEEG